MKATGDEAAEKFKRFVKLANGDSYLVYLALSSLENPTDKDVECYINNNNRNGNKTMEPQQRHTPTPWKISGNIIFNDALCGDQNYKILWSKSNGRSRDIAYIPLYSSVIDKDAVFLLKAVNLHEELVTTLMMAYEVIIDHCFSFDEDTSAYITDKCSIINEVLERTKKG